MDQHQIKNESKKKRDKSVLRLYIRIVCITCGSLCAGDVVDAGSQQRNEHH